MTARIAACYDPDVVERARQRLDGITPGPWRVQATDFHHDEDTEYRVLVDDDDPGTAYIAEAVSQGRADASFIAAAPVLVRDLVAEVERLTAERDEARTEVERLEADLDGAAYRAGRKQGELAVARAAVERLRTDLARMTERAEGAEVAWTDTITERDEALAVIERVRDLARRADRAEADLMRDEYQGEPGWVQAPDILRALDGGERRE